MPIPSRGSGPSKRLGEQGRRSNGPTLHTLVAAGLLSLLATAVFALPGGATSGILTITADTTLSEDHQGEIVIDADGVTLDCDGYKVVGSGEENGIKISERSDVTLRDCRVSGFVRGVLVNVSSQIDLQGNEASRNEWGFWIADSDHVRAASNTASDNSQNGFLLGNADDGLLSGNRALRNGLNGFGFNDSDREVLSSNLSEDNAERGFFLRTSRGTILENNVARRNETGFVLEESPDSAVQENLASDNRIDGFFLASVDGGHLYGNSATGNAHSGFHIDESSDVVFSANHAEGNGTGAFRVRSSSDLEFSENIIVTGLSRTGRDYPPQGGIATELLSFLGLASAVWLGLYLIGQPPRRPTTWLTSLTLFSLAGVFLADFMNFNQPAVGFLQQIQGLFASWPGSNEVIARFLFLGWIDNFAVVFWYHATSLMRSGGLTRRRKAVLAFGYLLATVAAVVQISRPDAFVASAGSLRPNDSLAGPLNPVLAASLIVFTALCLVNLIAAARAARVAILRRQFILLIAATIIAGLSGPVFILRANFGVPIPTIVGTTLLWLAVALVGYGVAQYSAVVEGRTIRRHFAYSLVSVGLITLVYFFVSYLSSLSFGVRPASFVLVILLAVVTHSLIGNARAFLDVFFFDPETRRVRRTLRGLTNDVGEKERLEERLRLALDALCTRVRATFGFVFLVSEDALRLVASSRWTRPTDFTLSPGALAPDDIQPLEPGTMPEPLDGAAILAPLFLESEHLGAVLLGHPVNGTRYSPGEVELIGYVSDQMVEMIRVDRQRRGVLDQMAEIPHEVGPVDGLTRGELSTESVEIALRRMNDFVYLGSCPISQLRTVSAGMPAGSATYVDRGKSTHRVLAEAIENLRPSGQKPTLSSPREWHHYMILHEAYVMDRPNRDVMAELYISEGTFNRRRREAIEAVTRMLREGEGRGERPTGK